MVDAGWVVRRLPRFARRHQVIRALIRVGLNPETEVSLLGGARMQLDLRDLWARAALKTGSYYPQYQDIAAAILVEGGTYFDVGANLGFMTFGFLPRVPSERTQFHLFEANPRCCELLSRSAAKQTDSNIWVNHACVTDRPGSSSLIWEQENSGVGHIGDGGVQCPNLLLDDYIEAAGIDDIKLMKLDIEGWEPMALRGAERSLTRGAIEIICTEVSSEALGRNGHSSARYLAMLREYGFELFYFRNEDLGPEGPAAGIPTRSLPVAGGRIDIAPVAIPPSHLQTDILAIRANLIYSIPD